MRLLFAISVFFILCSVLPAQRPSGSICVAPNPSTNVEINVPGGLYDRATLMLQIDKRAPIRWPRKNCAKVDGLDLSNRHLAVILSKGRPFQSFHFRFLDYKSANLCLLFDGIGAPELQDDTRYTPWCKCKQQKGTVRRSQR